MFIIENNELSVRLNPMGGELDSLVKKETGQEYMWSGDIAFWRKKSPVLFPIVGTLKEGLYFFKDKSYPLSRHGFAREKMFSVREQTPHSIHFELENDADTLEVFPFQFSFSIIYSIESYRLQVTYLIKNMGTETMFFSVGGHPAFKLPLADGLAYEDYYLRFNKIENTGRWPITAEGLISATPFPLLNDTTDLPLSKELFYKDAIVFKNLQSDEVALKSDKHPEGFNFSFKGFPYLGIWAANNADFICIEPWCGIADSENSKQLLIEKEGIVNLPTGEWFERSWSITV